MVQADRSGAAALEVGPEVSPVAIPLEAFPMAVTRVAMVEEAEVVDPLRLINRKEDHPILFFFLSLTGLTEGCKFTLK